MKQKEIDLYMDMAKRVAEMSHAVRLKVGMVIARPGGLFLAYGYNGMPAGDDNCCERRIYFNPEIEDLHWDEIKEAYPYIDEVGSYRLETKIEVLHAEPNAIAKCAREGRSTLGAWGFQTHSPCIHCAKIILQAGLSHVIYGEQYRSNEGIEFLTKRGIHVRQYKEL